MDRDRVYTEQEVIRIIERAIEHKEKEPRDHSKRGLTLAEIERLGEEVGLSTGHLQRAAAEVGAIGVATSEELAGTGKHVRIERWIPGRLSEMDIENMFAEIKNHLGPDQFAANWWTNGQDTVKRMGRTLEWSHSDMHLSVTKHDEGYVLRAVSSQLFSGTGKESVFVSLWVALAVGGLFAGAIGEAHGVLWGLLILSIATILSFLIVPRSITRSRARTERKLEAVANQAEELLLAAAETLREKEERHGEKEYLTKSEPPVELSGDETPASSVDEATSRFRSRPTRS